MKLSDRLIPLEGVHNFRDFGGWPLAGGGRVRTGLLFRSGHMGSATEADVDAVDDLGLDFITDLRRPSERAAQPNRALPSDPAVLSSDDGNAALAPHLAFLRDSDVTEAGSRDYMIEAYRRIPLEAGHINVFHDYFVALVNAERGALVHCAAGKDRTGILCALTLMLIGAEREAIFEDYLLTLEAVDYGRLIPSYAKHWSQSFGRVYEEAALKPMMCVEAVYLETAFEAMGDARAYARAKLGVDDGMLDKIKARLIA